MSAFILNRDHIDFMVSAAINLGTGRGYGLYFRNSHTGIRERVNLVNADMFGAMLIGENITSVQYRYHGEDVTTLPGPIDKSSLLDYTYRRFTVRTPYQLLDDSIAQVYKAIACYEYQSCEHPGWVDSEAKRVCDDMRRAYVALLPGYEEAQWEITREDIA